MALGTLWLFASAAPAFAVAAEGPPPVAAATASRDFPKRLAITVVAEEGLIGTFQQRVSSWFSDGTEVLVSVTSEVNEAQLLTSSPVEVRAWIVPLSTESALLTFSCVSPPAPPRHLVREVHLRSGLDEIGLERLASVVHSAFVALSQGVEGVEREQAERELGAVGVATGSFAPASPAAAPVAAAPPAALGQAPPVPPTRAEAPPPDRAATHAKEPPVALLVAAGYGVRLRGPEGVGHGPSLTLGAQLRGARSAFDLQLSGQYLFSSDFDAPPFSASVQTTALRAQIGIEPRLKSSLFGQVLLGLGADIAQVSARASSSSAMLVAVPRADGTQVRSVGEFSLGIVRHGELLDVGLVVQVHFAFEQVQYTATTSEGEAQLVAPWPIQPALNLQGRFRSAL